MRCRANFRKRPEARICCDKICEKTMRSGENNFNWKGGKKFKRGSKGGHVLIYAPNHPNARKNFIAEHRLVMEKHIGRLLLEHEVVHHIDCDPSNNALSNLYLESGHTDHNITHASLNKCVARLMQMGALKFNKENGLYYV